LSQPTPSSNHQCHCQTHLILTRPLLPRRRIGRDVDTPYSLHGTTVFARPICGTIAGLTFRANSWALPLPDRACDAIDCLDVLAHIRDDEAMIAEFARVLHPGGMLCLRVPNAGPLAGLDAYNLYRYLSDITHRGRKPVETDEVGWRRHYSRQDLAALLGTRFVVRKVTTQRIGVAEMLNAAALAIFRWFQSSDARYRRASALIGRIERFENRIKPGLIGIALTIEAVRAPEID